ncbi:MAG: threonine synthase [Pseudomonadota bacterium]
MKYVSTRGQAPDLGFCDVLLTGLARDGGLYVPDVWPTLDEGAIRAFRGMPYAQVAKTVLWPFVEGEVERSAFEDMVDEAYATFRHPAVCPLVQVGEQDFILELFHGPTLAFKDVAMQLLARLMDHVLGQRDARATVVGATSGDTGGAAIDAFKGRDRADMFILFPHGRVSEVQRRQMTTVHDKGVHAVAIEGNFDDCQDLVKAMFNDHRFRDGVGLSGVNSINWARIMAQVVYYFTAAASLGAPDRPVSFSVPTGNFGDVFAGYVAKRMGLNASINALTVATNRNDILARCLATGRYEKLGVEASHSPSMDIEISSNFERLLYFAHDRDAAKVQALMDRLKQSGAFDIDPGPLAAIRSEFAAGACSEDETLATIKRVQEETGYLLDPHTAVGLKVAEEAAAAQALRITLGTAHPAKFPDSVERAVNMRPALPHWLGDLMEREERFDVLPATLNAVQDYISQRSRAAQNTA